MMEMVSEEDHRQLEQATELVRGVIERHRSEDLRAISVLNSAIQEIRVGERYLDSDTSPAGDSVR
ncbi:hypothetical protein [Haloechinothrix alba]|nr:hypothetical protein [Haloechinothrix alba]